MHSKNCFFIGHRDAGEELRPLLAEAVERHITQYGVTDFCVGQYGRFDTMAAQTVLNAKKRHPAVTLTLLLAYYPKDRAVPPCDLTFYPPGMETVPKRIAIVRANRYMVDHCGYLIAYAQYPASNARELAEYAAARQRKGLIHVENLAEKMGKSPQPILP